MRYPLTAAAGALLVWARLETNLWVLDATGADVLASRRYPEHRIMETLCDLVTLGFIEPLNATEAARFSRPPRPVLMRPQSLPRPVGRLVLSRR